MRTLFKALLASLVIITLFIIKNNEVFASDNGTVWYWQNALSIPTQIQGLKDVISVSIGGGGHILFLKENGTVWSIGNNNFGQLGNGFKGGSVSVPVQVKDSSGIDYFSNVKAVAAGQYFSMALKKDGSVWVWGNNWNGIRGTGVGINQYDSTLTTPHQVKQGWGMAYLSSIVAIAAGNDHLLALKSDGSVLTWGTNDYGQAGTGCVGGNCSFVYFPQQIKINDIKTITAGWLHSLALKTDGTVWGWGRTYEGQLGPDHIDFGSGIKPSPVQIKTLNNINAISARVHYNLAMDSQGKVFQWGAGDPNVKPIPNIQDIKIIAAGSSIGLALLNNGTVWQWYSNNTTPNKVTNLTNVATIVGGESSMPHLAVIGNASVSSSPDPFLELPWGHGGLTFNDAALSINSFFDHEYPLLSRLSAVPEPATLSATLTNFRGITASGSALPYSSHDGYDYGKRAKANNNDPVFAAASGSASLEKSCLPACGNAIVIDHGNGYQTRYYHLQEEGLISTDSAKTVFVNAGDQIGKVGSTGKSTGAHIHFMVVQDKEGNGDFEDNIPDGVVDPFGWQSKNQDPWEIYPFTYAGQNRTGSKSYYLWKNKLDELQSKLTSSGGQFSIGRFTFTFPANVVNQDTDILLQSAPLAQSSASLISLGPTLEATAKDQNGNLITQFLSNFTMFVNFSQFDISTIDTNTISIYSSMDGINWNKEATQVDLNTMTATGQVNHFSHFAVMAQRKDTTLPVTNPVLIGDEGNINWFRSDVTLNLNAQDNQGGLGIDYTMYKLENGDWEQYTSPLIFTQEGHYKVEFYSADLDENIEDIKSIEFDIDKTPPEIEVGFNPTKLALDLVGKDGSQSASVSQKKMKKDRTQITIKDQAGNTLVLETRYKTEKTIRFEIFTLQYNNQHITELAKNIFEASTIHNKEKNTLQKLTQFFSFGKDFRIQFKYDKENDKTRILTIQNKKEQREERNGIVLLKLFTQNGKLLHSY